MVGRIVVLTPVIWGTSELGLQVDHAGGLTAFQGVVSGQMQIRRAEDPPPDPVRSGLAPTPRPLLRAITSSLPHSVTSGVGRAKESIDRARQSYRRQRCPTASQTAEIGDGRVGEPRSATCMVDGAGASQNNQRSSLASTFALAAASRYGSPSCWRPWDDACGVSEPCRRRCFSSQLP
jgi:hypothetical protein